MALGHYGAYVCSIFGAILSESSDTSWGNENADSDVNTQLDGFKGVTPHGGKTMCSVTLFDPVSGSIVSTLQGYEKGRTIVDFSVLQIGGGKTMKTKGFIRNVKGSSAVGSNATITFDFHGPEADFV